MPDLSDNEKTPFDDGLPDIDEPRGRGRPDAEIDVNIVMRAAAIGCTDGEIAVLCGVARSTFYLHLQNDQELAEAVEAARENGKSSLRRMQWRNAREGNATMQIWLGKQRLGQRDHKELTGANGGPIDVRNLSTDQIIATLAALGADGDTPVAGGTGEEEG